MSTGWIIITTFTTYRKSFITLLCRGQRQVRSKIKHITRNIITLAMVRRITSTVESKEILVCKSTVDNQK